ncbi:endolytic transglycosylase MltG [Marinicella sediminis]|uniref:Endolytic murein transglycosylase n=1 Tax=Marinicella sediminis TaxID=1792834 RepID=A0ABV7JE40_9GAMM|nr:endolytic transglycosylase MltG [Marinicella sediminis]
MKKTLLLLLLLMLLVGAGFVGWHYKAYRDFLNQPVFVTYPVVLEIDKGTSYGHFVQMVKSQQGQGELIYWKLLARLNDVQHKIKAGEFEISQAMTPLELIDYIDGNQVKTYAITLVEGHNWKQIRAQLKSSDIRQVASDMTEEQLINWLGIEAGHLEGQFLPETYQYTRDESDLDVLVRAHQAMKQVLNDAWSGRVDGLLLKSPYELLILASIIEKETAVSTERNIISGVFHRRLKQGMKLQTDPTVIYGVGDAYAGDITRQHLVTDTPYNTYTRKGLTPTPIAMPGAASIRAAAHPNEGKELYFVANNQGGHTFSETYEQHQQAVAAYLRGN